MDKLEIHASQVKKYRLGGMISNFVWAQNNMLLPREEMYFPVNWDFIKLLMFLLPELKLTAITTLKANSGHSYFQLLLHQKFLFSLLNMSKT